MHRMFFSLPARVAANILLLLFVVLCLAPTSAMAHASLTKAVPAQRAIVFAPPDRIQLWFNERLEPAFCELSVSDASGATVDKGDAKVGADDPKLLTIGLKPVGAGVYTVKFRVLSVDGHVVTNQFNFTVRERR